MKSALFSILILMLSAGFCLAEQGERTRQHERRIKLSKRVVTPMAGKYSSMLGSIISTAEGMEITDEKKQKLSEIQNNYVSSLRKQEYEFKKLHFQIMKDVEDPSFDAEKLKKEIEEANKINTNSANDFVDALVMVRDVLGKEMYGEVNKSIRQHEQDLIQLRRERIMRIRSQIMRRQPDTQTEESGETKVTDTDKSSTDQKE